MRSGNEAGGNGYGWGGSKVNTTLRLAFPIVKKSNNGKLMEMFHCVYCRLQCVYSRIHTVKTYLDICVKQCLTTVVH